MQCEVWSVECEDFASSLAEKIKRLSREGHGRDRLSLNYRSFMFGKLPPPACPGLCYGSEILGLCYGSEILRYNEDVLLCHLISLRLPYLINIV